MERKETTVQCATLILKHTHFHLYASLTEFADATSLNLGKLIDAANDNTSDALPYNQVSAGRRLPVMRTWFEADVHRRLTK